MDWSYVYLHSMVNICDTHMVGFAACLSDRFIYISLFSFTRPRLRLPDRIANCFLAIILVPTKFPRNWRKTNSSKERWPAPTLTKATGCKSLVAWTGMFMILSRKFVKLEIEMPLTVLFYNLWTARWEVKRLFFEGLILFDNIGQFTNLQP